VRATDAALDVAEGGRGTEVSDAGDALLDHCAAPGAEQLVQTGRGLGGELDLDCLGDVSDANQVGAVMAAVGQGRGEVAVALGTLAGHDLAFGEEAIAVSLEAGGEDGDGGLVDRAGDGEVDAAELGSAAGGKAGAGRENEAAGSADAGMDDDQAGDAEAALALQGGGPLGVCPERDRFAWRDAEAGDELEHLDIALADRVRPPPSHQMPARCALSSKSLATPPPL
jgi:hypothetical protein